MQLPSTRKSTRDALSDEQGAGSGFGAEEGTYFFAGLKIEW